MSKTTRRGYILIFVLGVTTVVTALGLSYIASNGTVMTQATNRASAVRAQYVAESGAALAQHYLRYSPTTVVANGFYTGGTGIAIDSTFDTVDISVSSTAPANHYVINSTATVRNATGTVSLAKQSVRSEVVIPPLPKWNISQALLVNSSVNVQSGVTIKGNLHANGGATGPLFGGSCNGAVSATGTALWLAAGSPTSVQSLQPAVTCPPVTSSLYQNYNILGNAYTAYMSYSRNDMGDPDATSLGSLVNAGGSNPGRIAFMPTGTFKVKANVNFTGMLVVRGNLEVDGPNITLQAVKDYPALFVTGDILCKSSSRSMTVTGPVICGGTITDDGRSSCSLIFNGATILTQGISRTGSSSTIQFVWNSTNSVFWNMAKSANPDPFTTLEWSEN